MPAFTSTYSRKHREALCTAVLDRGMSVRAALDAAKAGELDGLDAADAKQLAGMSYNHACSIVREERPGRNGVQLSRTGADGVTRDAATLILRRALRDAAKIANGRKALMVADDALKTLRVIEAAQKVLAGLEAKAKPSAGTEQKTPSKPRGLAAQIAAQRDTEPDDLPSEPTPSEAQAVGDNEQEGTADNTDAGAARQSAASLSALAPAA